MKKILFCLVLSSTIFSFAQSKSFQISGTLISEDGNLPLESATVHVERVKDSSLVTYTISDKDGNFELEGKNTDKSLNLFVSYVGYKTLKKTIILDLPVIKLGSINLETDTNALDAVIVKSRAPITIKKDTLEFNVKSFKTKKGATVEDVIKTIPGFEVDEAGKITHNGKEINNILVNGKPFFGNDPTVATKNLTKDIIEKIQVVDTKSKAEAFTGQEGESDNKTINLTIKKENNKGVFGRLAAGAGTNKRNEFAGMFNHFDNDQRISVLAGGNNINSPGFSFGEIRKMFGGGNSMSMSGNGTFSIDGRSFGGGEGITVSRNAGANYADKYGEKVDVSADYFYSGSSSENNTIRERENILPDSRYFSDKNTNSNSTSDNHSANLGFDIKVDSTLLINVKPSFSFSESTTDYGSDEESMDEAKVLINKSKVSSKVDNVAKKFSNRVNVTKRFGSKGSFLRVNISNELNNSESEDFLNSETNIYGNTPNDIIRKQFTDGNRKISNFNVGTSYRLPLKGKKLSLTISYDYSRNKNENEKSTYDFDDTAQDYTVFNTDLSTDFEYLNKTNKSGLSLDYRKKKLSTSFRVSHVNRSLENIDLLRPSLSIQRDFENVELRSRIRYRFSPKASFRVGYRLSNNIPNLSQLQPFQDVSNPLNTIIGNPDLKTTKSHRVDLGINAFDFQKGTGFYVFLNGQVSDNQVVTKSLINEDLIRTTTYENVNGNYNVSAHLNYSKKVKLDSLSSIKAGLGTSIRLRRNISFNNGVKYASNVRAIGPSLKLEYNMGKDLFLTTRYNVSFTNNNYDIANFKDEKFLAHSLNINSRVNFLGKFEWQNDIDFSYNPTISDGFQKSAWFWNSTLGYSFMKDRATLTLKAYDLLNQQTNARRIASQNYIEDSQSTVLQQYFMLSFSWKFNSLGSKGEVGKQRSFHFH